MKKSKTAKGIAAAALSLGILGGGLFVGCSTPTKQADVPPTNNQTTVDDYQSQLDQFKQELQNLQSKNEQFKSELNDMQSQVDKLKNDIKTLNTKYTEFITNYNALEFTVEMLRRKAETNSENISSLQQDLSTANGLISTLQANIAELKQLTQNTELGDKVAALESMLNNMSLSVYKLQLGNIVDNTFKNQAVSCFVNLNQSQTNMDYYETSNGDYGYKLGNTYVVSQDNLIFTNNNGEESISSIYDHATIPSLLKSAINSSDSITKTDNGYVCSADENGLKMSIEVLKGRDQIWSVDYQNNEIGHVYSRRNNIMASEAQAQIEYYASQIPSYGYYNEIMSNIDDIFNNPYVDVTATMQQSVAGDVVDSQTQRIAASSKHTAMHSTSTRHNGEYYGIKEPNNVECIYVEDGKPQKAENQTVSKSMLHSSLKLSIEQGLSKILYDVEQDEFTLTSEMYDQTTQVKIKKLDGHLKIEVSNSQYDENATTDYTQTFDISALTKENFQQFYQQVEGQINEYLSQLELSK